MGFRFGRSRPRAHFLHIGKTGGTAINAALEPLARRGRYEIVLEGHDVNLSQIPVGDKFFFVVRDPLDRFISSFNDRQRCSRPRYDVGWTLEEERAYGIFATPDSLGSGLSSEDPMTRTAAEEAMSSIYHVRHTYWHWFQDPVYFQSRLNDLLLVMWLPSLDASFRRLCRILGLKAVDLPADDVGAHRQPSSAPRFLSDEARHNLERWYAADYAFLDTCRRVDQADPELRHSRQPSASLR